MAEELELTTPLTKCRVLEMFLRYAGAASLVHILVEVSSEGATTAPSVITHDYTGTEAEEMLKYLNTANMSTTSMHKRVLQKLANDGIIPGTVTGTPDP